MATGLIRRAISRVQSSSPAARLLVAQLTLRTPNPSRCPTSSHFKFTDGIQITQGNKNTKLI
ncbi:hypothetical protein KY290_015308 [Solanum tuberosum]|uniref:Uncharacterized protein n=1 Tax=Solanum tuberosum TaxID=4113 RepID=A0ABQ7VS32_SOLTU|nr:hypothetical protein KY289_014923 [Solanum tuberosum]KAH0771327.1 hypothetical protein KY290_015308 [Solanum tuberosum]